MNKQDIAIAVISVIVIIIGVISYLIYRNVPGEGIKVENTLDKQESETNLPPQTNESPDTESVQSSTSDQSNPDIETVSLRGEKVTNLTNELQSHPDTLTASLTDVTNGTSGGTGLILRENNELKHTVIADLPELEGLQFYEGWLVQQSPRLQFFSTGKMEKREDGSFGLSFITEDPNTTEPFPTYNFVVITLEEVDDGQPERHIIEGQAQ